MQAHQATGKTQFLLFADTLSFRKIEESMSSVFVKCIQLASFSHLILSTIESMGLTFYYQSAELLFKSDPITYSCIYSPCCDQQHLHPESRSIS